MFRPVTRLAVYNILIQFINVAGKRDIKVRALEAAEAAKRQEEKKENERKIKKEALKLERAKIEQETLRQRELDRRKKEEELKKKEADLAARKRLREEEGRMEKERKRKRIVGWQGHRVQEEKKLAGIGEKEKRCANTVKSLIAIMSYHCYPVSSGRH